MDVSLIAEYSVKRIIEKVFEISAWTGNNSNRTLWCRSYLVSYKM